MTHPGAASTETTKAGNWAIPLLFFAIKVLVHLPWLERYGYHRDELYFIDCGGHLAFGYVDHAPLVPWLARLAGVLFDHDLAGLRMFAVLAGAGATALTAAMAGVFGGGRLAQVLAGAAVLVAPAYLRMAKILSIPAIELLWWTWASYLLARLIREDAPRRWWPIGLVAGLGLLTKHTMLLWGLGVAVGVLATPLRRHLRTPWPWLALGLAVVCISPNLVWQYQHDWPTLTFISNVRQGMLARVPKPLFVAGQLLYMHPLSIPLWLGGLAWLFRGEGKRYRVFAWLYITGFATLLLTGAKPYYLAPAYPALLSAGAVGIERGSHARLRAPVIHGLVAGWLVASAAFAFSLALPVLPLPQLDALVGRLFGSAVPDRALTHDLHDEYGWPEQAQTVARLVRMLPPEERNGVALLVGNYGEASALAFFGSSLPRPASGHMTHYFWTRPERLDRASVVLAYGFDRELLERLFADVQPIGQVDHPLAERDERHLTVFACRRPRVQFEKAWPALRRFHHSRSKRPVPEAFWK